MPLHTDFETGTVQHSSPLPAVKLHQPSRREIQTAWDNIILSLTPSLLEDLEKSLETLRRHLNVE